MPDAIRPKKVQDQVAEKLEAAGLWRRASARWLVVMNQFKFTDAQREWIRQRRQYCQSRVTPVAVMTQTLDIVAINKAANVTQAQMGLSRPGGSMFRTYPEGHRAVKHK